MLYHSTNYIKMLKHLTNKRAETILEVTIALFVIGVVLNVQSITSNRMLNLTAQNHLRENGEFLAREGLEGVFDMRETNYLRYAPPECWKTIETTDVCDPSTSLMMDDTTPGAKFYSIFFDHLDFTWNLENQMEASQSNFLFDDNAVLARLPNIYSIH